MVDDFLLDFEWRVHVGADGYAAGARFMRGKCGVCGVLGIYAAWLA